MRQDAAGGGAALPQLLTACPSRANHWQEARERWAKTLQELNSASPAAHRCLLPDQPLTGGAGAVRQDAARGGATVPEGPAGAGP